MLPVSPYTPSEQWVILIIMKNTRSALSVASVASRLEVCELTVRRLIQSGDLRAVRVGRLVRVPIDEVERLVAKARRERGPRR